MSDNDIFDIEPPLLFPHEIKLKGAPGSILLHADGRITGDVQAYLDYVAAMPAIPGRPEWLMPILWLMCRAIKDKVGV